MWQAMLMASNLPNSHHIIIDGFITSGGQKMSKSLGNVISPFDVIDMFKDVTDYPEEVLRFVLLHDISSFEDGDITVESIKTTYAAHLQNGIGNLTSRIMKMATVSQTTADHMQTVAEKVNVNLENFDIKKAIEEVTAKIASLDKKIQSEEPFKVIKVDEEKGKAIIRELLIMLHEIASDLEVFLPKTSTKILECIRENKMPEKPLFNRLA
jgi:methionyl-tRNA synthetase